MADNTQQAALTANGAELRLALESKAQQLCDLADEELMLAHGAGSEAAFEELLRRHHRPVLNYVTRMVSNRHVAEELTQEVFMALVKNARRYQPLAKFTTYLYAIASNIVSKEWLRRKRRPRLLSLTGFGLGKREEDDGDPLERFSDDKCDVQTAFERGEITEAVNRALDKLPAHQREAFVLRRFQDLSYEEIAAVTNAPVGTAKSRVVRAERALRPHLEPFRAYL
jgi:RNA polymerase sigma-70 factor (ECF subfamily)